MATPRTGLSRFLGNQRARIEARLRKPFRTHTYQGTGGITLSTQDIACLERWGLDELPNNFINRAELVRATDMEYRR